ncbi:hypothetical protein AB0J14_17220 [Micromonospora arborensis]|uniref:hypothetical protein n=1 Tax=Micromonospora arborensis TaxID=2116518 RepID=UPI0033D4A465
MTRYFGDRSTFGVEVGEIQPPSLRVVDLWVAGKRLTIDDSSAFVPSLSHAMRSTAAQVRKRDVKPCPFPGRDPEETFRLLHADETEFREQFWFMQWGEIVDNVSTYAYLDRDLVILFAFWRAGHPFPDDLGKVFVTRIPPDDFAATVEEAADLLDAEFVIVKPAPTTCEI